jgi:hypothetical protein
MAWTWPSSCTREPLRPLWICRNDAQPWPCAQARLGLTAGYRGLGVGLACYLAMQYVDALTEVHTLNPDTAPDPRSLWERMIGWGRTRQALTAHDLERYEGSGGAAGPGPGVGVILDGERRFAEVKRAEGVHHDREFVEIVDPDGAFRRAGLRAVGEAGRVQ